MERPHREDPSSRLLPGVTDHKVITWSPTERTNLDGPFYLRSVYGKAARKGSLINQTGTDVGPKPPPVIPDNSQFRQRDLGGVVSSPKGASLAQRGGRGAPPAMPGDTPLLGHQALDPTNVSAEAPSRGQFSQATTLPSAVAARKHRRPPRWFGRERSN